MTEEEVQNTVNIEPEAPALPVETPEDYIRRLQRTMIAVTAGLVAGVICFATDLSAGATLGGRTFLFPILVLIASIMIQKHIFRMMKMDTNRLEKKDWIFQSFMTFSFWFVTWTILLSGAARTT